MTLLPTPTPQAKARAGARVKVRLADTSGASIVIALVFFLICAVVGATVLTAASTNAQAAATYRETREARYEVDSAAALVGGQLQSEVSVAWDWSEVSETKGPTLDTSAFTGSALARAVWTELADDLWSYQSGEGEAAVWIAERATLSGLEITGIEGMDTVYASLTIDADFGVTVLLSLSDTPGAMALYDETVYLQARPEYADNRLIALTWETPTIVKTGNE